MKILDNDSFLTQLTRIFEKTKPSGKRVYITMKRYEWKSKKQSKGLLEKTTQPSSEGDVKKDETENTIVYPCLMRARSGNIKISTMIQPPDSDKFHTEYINILKVHMDSMKKKDRKKEKEKKKIKIKAKATAS